MNIRTLNIILFIQIIFTVLIFTGCAKDEDIFVGQFTADLNISEVTETTATCVLTLSESVVAYGGYGPYKVKVYIDGKEDTMASIKYGDYSFSEITLPDGGIRYKWTLTGLEADRSYSITCTVLGAGYFGDYSGIYGEYNSSLATATADFTTLQKYQGDIIVSDITSTTANFEIIMPKTIYDAVEGEKALKVDLNGKIRYLLAEKRFSNELYVLKDLSDGRVSLTWTESSLTPNTDYSVSYEYEIYEHSYSTAYSTEPTFVFSGKGRFTTLPLGEWMQEPFYCIIDNYSSYIEVRCSSPYPWSFTPGFAYTLHLTSIEDSSVNYEFHPSEMSTSGCMFSIQKKNVAKGKYTYYLEGPVIQDESGYQSPDNTKIRPSEYSPAYIVI